MAKTPSARLCEIHAVCSPRLHRNLERHQRPNRTEGEPAKSFAEGAHVDGKRRAFCELRTIHIDAPLRLIQVRRSNRKANDNVLSNNKQNTALKRRADEHRLTVSLITLSCVRVLVDIANFTCAPPFERLFYENYGETLLPHIGVPEDRGPRLEWNRNDRVLNCRTCGESPLLSSQHRKIPSPC